jgi:hypothetical protein
MLKRERCTSQDRKAQSKIKFLFLMKEKPMKEQNEKKAIEEMTAFLWKNTLIHTEDLCHDVAETVIKEGYRKQSVGEWLFNRGRTYGEPAYYCSACSEGASEYGYDNFCPNCGARMKGGAE